MLTSLERTQSSNYLREVKSERYRVRDRIEALYATLEKTTDSDQRAVIELQIDKLAQRLRRI
jgi:hypothetical protein